MVPNHRCYVSLLVTCFALTLLPVFILNLQLARITLGNNQIPVLASEWQQRSHGMTNGRPFDNHLFKTLRLTDRLPEINTIIFGSSTRRSCVRRYCMPPTINPQPKSMQQLPSLVIPTTLSTTLRWSTVPDGG